MKKIILLLSLLFIIILSLIFYKWLFQKENNEICSILKINCPDGFLSECNSIYDESSKNCIECIPDCTGHETPINKTDNNSSQLILCPEILPSSNFCKGGEIVPIYNDIGCAIDYECK